MKKYSRHLIVAYLFLLGVTGCHCQGSPVNQNHLERCKQKVHCNDVCNNEFGCHYTPSLPAVFVACNYNNTSELSIKTLLKDKETNAGAGLKTIGRYNNLKRSACEAFQIYFSKWGHFFVIETTVLEEPKIANVTKEYNVSSVVYFTIGKGNCYTKCDLGEKIITHY